MTDQETLPGSPAAEQPAVGETLLQAQDAFEDFISTKLKSYAEHNIAAALEFVSRLHEAKTFQDVIQIQTEFMQLQLQSFGEQAKQFSEICMKAGPAAFNMPFHLSASSSE